MIGALDISTSGLVAQRIRLDTIASNIANATTQRNGRGELKPFKMRYVEFQPDEDLQMAHGAVGVKVAAVKTETKDPTYVYEPGNPLAIKSGKWKGYVAYPNVSMTREFVDALEATRAYEANIGIMEVTKNMGAQTLRILA